MFYPLGHAEQRRWAAILSLPESDCLSALEREAAGRGLQQERLDSAVAWSDGQGRQLVLLFRGAVALRRRGRPDHRRDDDSALLGIERTTRLVTTGVYRRIRHPMHSSLLLLAWGVFLKHPSWVGAALALTASACLLATAKVEEQENLCYFGPGYRTYMKGTTRFLPIMF